MFSVSAKTREGCSVGQRFLSGFFSPGTAKASGAMSDEIARGMIGFLKQRWALTAGVVIICAIATVVLFEHPIDTRRTYRIGTRGTSLSSRRGGPPHNFGGGGAFGGRPGGGTRPPRGA